MNSKEFPCGDWYREEDLHSNLKAAVIRIKSLEQKLADLRESDSKEWRQFVENELAALNGKLDVILQRLTGGMNLPED
jgi:hypothetical protein